MPIAEPTVIFIVGAVLGYPCPERQQYLVAYDPDRNPPHGHFRTHENPSRAKIFRSAGEALAVYRKQSTVQPLRPDGEPNRPMTAFTVEILSLREAIKDYRERCAASSDSES